MQPRTAVQGATLTAANSEPSQGRGQVDPALTLKVMPPRPRKDMLLRQRLDLPFTRYADVPVVIAEAPAGYGKTLLLAQWRRAAMARPASAAWLTLDERDDERRLLEGLALSLRQATGRADFALGISNAANDPDWAIKAAAGLLAEWSRLSRPVVLILDDFDRLASPRAREIGRYLIANLPANGRIFMGMRGIDNRPWALELQAYGQLAVVGRNELGFTIEESIEFLEQRLPGGLAGNIAAQMHERTGGWPLGLELFVAGITAKRGAPSSLRSAQIGSRGFSAALVEDGARNLAAHLIERAIGARPKELRTFLLEISILDHLHSDLCAAVTGREDSEELLTDLRHSTPLVLETEDGPWFRLHHLALDHLREELEKLPPERLRLLHSRAARWLMEHGSWEAATQHAFEAGETRLAFDGIEHSVDALIAAGRFELVDDWLKRVPAAEIAERRQLRLAVAFRKAMAGSPEHAELTDDLARSSTPKLRFAAAVVRAVAAGHTDDPDSCAAALAEWREEPCSENPVMLRAFYNTRRWLDELEGQPKRPKIWGDGASPVLGKASLGGSVSLFRQALAYLNNGQPLLASRVLMPGLARFEAHTGRRSAPAVLVAFSLAAAACERDEIAQIRVLIADRMDLLDPPVMPDALWMGYISAAALAEADGQNNRALNLLELLLERARTRGLVRVQAIAAAELVRLHAAAGRPELCERLAAEVREIADALSERGSLNGPPVQIHALLAEARSAWVRKDIETTLRLSEELCELSRRINRRRFEYEARLIGAAAQFEQSGETPPDLLEVASLARTLGLKRMLREAGAYLQPTLRRALTIRPEPEEFPRRAAEAAPSSRPTAEASAMLTSREAEVLVLLSRGMSNKEIANALDIGEGTIKWHLKNLFLKFEATDRKHVVARARLLGLIEAD